MGSYSFRLVSSFPTITRRKPLANFAYSFYIQTTEFTLTGRPSTQTIRSAGAPVSLFNGTRDFYSARPSVRPPVRPSVRAAVTKPVSWIGHEADVASRRRRCIHRQSRPGTVTKYVPRVTVAPASASAQVGRVCVSMLGWIPKGDRRERERYQQPLPARMDKNGFLGVFVLLGLHQVRLLQQFRIYMSHI